MTEPSQTQLPDLCESWCRIVAIFLDHQWDLLKNHWQLYLDIAGKTLPPSPPVRAAEPTDPVKGLEAEAVERIRKGLAPPHEIYEVPYRNRIDWSAFPDWARPCDPELFEECTHEG
jgi:hypothetical protein